MTPARLDHLGVIRARGADAARFLHGQLTSDMLGLEPSQARLAGYCSAKGRLLASFVVWRPGPDTFLLACAADLLAPTLKRLSMFVLRAQCRLDDASADVALAGVYGPPGDAAVAGLEGLGAWQARTVDGTTVARLPDAAGSVRGIVAGAPDAAPAPSAAALAHWRWLEVQSGVVAIEAATADRFVPQMVNHEAVGAVDFGKGCYPGQEVVARSQYRGTIKRRTLLFDCDALPAAGQDVFHDADAAEPAGVVAQAAPRPDGAGASALVEVRLALAGSAGTFRLGAPDGPPLVRRELPYELGGEISTSSGPP